VLGEADKLPLAVHVCHQRGAADLRREIERLRSALEELDTKLEIESSFEESGQMFVAFYRVPAGPWHKILGLIRGVSTH
jgi:hypothetical protein